MKKTLLFIVLAVFTLVSTAAGQSVLLSNTTLNGAITATQQTVRLTSASASSGSNVGAPAVGHWVWFASGEAARITAVNVGGVSTVFSIIRGVGPGAAGKPAAHKTSEPVLTGPPSAFQAVDGPAGVAAGDACVVANVGYQPWVNAQNSNVWLCRSSVWTGTNYAPLTYNSILLTP